MLNFVLMLKSSLCWALLQLPLHWRTRKCAHQSHTLTQTAGLEGERERERERERDISIKCQYTISFSAYICWSRSFHWAWLPRRLFHRRDLRRFEYQNYCSSFWMPTQDDFHLRNVCLYECVYNNTRLTIMQLYIIMLFTGTGRFRFAVRACQRYV